MVHIISTQFNKNVQNNILNELSRLNSIFVLPKQTKLMGKLLHVAEINLAIIVYKNQTILRTTLPTQSHAKSLFIFAHEH